MAENKKRNIASRLGQAIGVLVLLIVLLPFSLYIPWVQNIVKDYVCEWASEETGLDISIERILIKFPLDVSVDKLLVIEHGRDTMLQAGNFTAGIAVRPLFNMEVDVDKAELTDGLYRMVAEDSSMVLRANIDHCLVEGIEVDLNNNQVNLVEGSLQGGDIKLDYFPHNVVTECDTTESKPWKVRAYRLNLENIDYAMTMLPTIDNMKVHVAKASLVDGVVDTGERKVLARSLAIDSTHVNYVYPSEKFAKEYASLHPIPADTLCSPSDTIPWMVKADSLRLTGGSAVYALKDAKSRLGKGLDTDYIDVNDLDVAVTDFYNRGTDISLSLKNLALNENGSGLAVKKASGNIVMNDKLISLRDTKLSTMMSDLNLDAHIDLSLLDNPNKGLIQVTTDSKIALQDVSKLMPAYAPMLKTIPQLQPLSIKGDIKGNMSRVDIGSLTANLPRYARANFSGTLYNPTEFDKMSGEVKMDARFDNINFVKPTLLDKAMQRQVNFPPMSVNGTAKINRGNIAANAVMTLATGKLVGKGTFNAHNNAYSVDATFNNFPVKAIAPLSNTDNLTAHIRLNGTGFDFLNPKTDLDADIDLMGVNYNNALYRNLTTHVSMSGGYMNGNIYSYNDNCNVNVDVNGRINGNHYIIDAKGNVADLNLQALGMYEGACQGHGRFDFTGDIDLDNKVYDATVNLRDFEWQLDNDQFVAEIAQATFQSDATHTYATFDNEDNHLKFTSALGLDSLLYKFDKASNIAMSQFNRKSINIDTLQAAMPAFTLNAKMGTDGLVQRYLMKYNVDFRDVSLDMRNDSTIFVDGYVHSLSYDGTNIDTLSLKATQWNKYLAFSAHMGNRPGTMDEFAQVTARGGIKGSTLDFLVTQQNIHKETGYRLGCNATLTDTAVNMRMFPEQPIIGYRKWNMNKDNFFNLNYLTRMLDADLRLESDSSKIALTTNRQAGAGKEDLCLNIANLRIEEWTRFMPNIDPMSGVLNADIDLDYDGHNIVGKGLVDLNDFVYNGMREGDMKLETDFGLDPNTGGTYMNANMLVDGSKVAIAYGSLNDADNGNGLNLDMKLDRFPLMKLSPFIPGNLILLRGYANGDVKVGGTMDNPILNGTLVADSGYVTLPKYGSSLRLCSDKLSVVDNVLNFKQYHIFGFNDKPVNINGVVNVKDLTNPIIDLEIAGKDVQFIGSEQQSYSEIFGKAYADINASVKARDNYMNTRADLKLLSGSNITYVLQDELTDLTNKVDEKMVTFVNLNDSTGGTPGLMTASGTTATNIIANIEVEQGAKINAFLSPDGKDRATIDGSGRLRYSLDFAGKDVLSGTYNIESGNVRYSPPLISQKNFNILSGSTVTWTGDMFNPQLNISANEHVKTSVSTSGQGSRLVDFLITANLGGTLNNINLEFDMSTESDLSVMNELQSMSDVQRSQAAINMLLYNTYSGTNSAGTVNNLTASAALFSFLQSQLNTWAAKTLKGVDLSFGINQYEASSGHGTETSYSYRLSKNLFNDRFKIVVGGEYATDASAEENFSQNLISDISFEYSLNNTGTRYVRLFRHSGFESILEGQVTKTGVGFVMKHKVASLKSMFKRNPLKVVIMDTLGTKEEEPIDTLTKE